MPMPMPMPMPTTLEQLTSQAIALSPEDRARLADLLLASLPDGADEPLGEAWDLEIQRRIKTIESGTARLVSATDVHADARNIYQR
jgi:putative addiction module component (TIGR02574 family)